MNDILIAYIDKFNLKSYLNENLLSFIEIKYFKSGDTICRINEKINYLYFLVKGRTKVHTLLSTGKSLLLTLDKPLSLIGDLESFTSPLAHCTVVAIEDCICISIPTYKVLELGSNDPVFLKFIIDSLGNKLRSNSTYRSINLLSPLENRFASYLLSIPFYGDDSSIKIDKLTLVADLLGTSYRSLTRIIKKLTEKNILIKNGNIVTILNKHALSLLAKDIFKEYY